MYDWDLTVNWIVPHIDDCKHVRQIVASTEVDMNMVRACLRMLRHHGALVHVDIFRYRNVYERVAPPPRRRGREEGGGWGRGPERRGQRMARRGIPVLRQGESRSPGAVGASGWRHMDQRELTELRREQHGQEALFSHELPPQPGFVGRQFLHRPAGREAEVHVGRQQCLATIVAAIVSLPL